MSRVLLVVDGANTVGSRPDGWWRDRPGAARRLADRLAALRAAAPGLLVPPGAAGAEAAAGRTAVPVVLVLEGAARRGVPEGDHGGVRVVHAAGEGDDRVVEVAREARDEDPTRPVVVVTADRGLRARLAAVGAAAVGPGWLLGLPLPPAADAPGAGL